MWDQGEVSVQRANQDFLAPKPVDFFKILRRLCAMGLD